MRKNLTEEEILSHGFVDCGKPQFGSADKFYQKCYKDEDRSRKYFLDIYHYTLTHPTTREDLSGYELETQLYLKGTHEAVNMTFLNDDIDAAEEFINKLFELDMLDYYERD